MNIIKQLKKTTLSVVYEFISDQGKKVTRRQALTFMSPDASVEDKYVIGDAVGKILISNPTAIEDAEIYEILEV